MTFSLHPNLMKKAFVIDLPLCRVLLEDEKYYPWLFLVPRRAGISRMMDLAPSDQLLLMCELDLAQSILWDLFAPTQLNVAAIGNKTPQLHVHVIARYENDPAWPSSVWEHPQRTPYLEEEKQAILSKIHSRFSKSL